MASLEPEWSQELVCGELDLKLTLSTGQAFRWHSMEEEIWIGTIENL